ncbi:diacylglycerol/lipid kinase family protein [Nakamurella flavida]|nr:diacylglycerol kinase family protein [Nakamurella flavida]
MTQHDTVSPGDRQRRESGPLRCTVIVNPVRVTDIDERRAVVDAELAAAGWPAAHWVETTESDPGAGQARQAVADGYDVVFACGGDGTVRSCVEGLAGSDAALAVLPAGTGNLLAANLSLPDDPAEGVRLAVERGRRRMDVGEVDGQVFAVMAGMGFDAQLLDSASTKLKSVIGSPAYVVSALKHLRDRSMQVEIRIDDDAPMRRSARSVLVGNVGRLQGGVRLLPDAEPDNGQLEVAILAPRNLAHWVALAWGVLRRRKRVPNMEVLRGRHIVVTSERSEPREMDGDVIEPGRVLDVRVRPGALWLCVPQPDRTPDMAQRA